MTRLISILTIVCLCLMFGIAGMSYADSAKNIEVIMQEHIEKMKRTKPEKYQAMVERAGGNITDCLSCHEEVGKEKDKK